MKPFHSCESCGSSLIVEHRCQRCGHVCGAFGITREQHERGALDLIDEVSAPALVQGGQGNDLQVDARITVVLFWIMVGLAAASGAGLLAAWAVRACGTQP